MSFLVVERLLLGLLVPVSFFLSSGDWDALQFALIGPPAFAVPLALVSGATVEGLKFITDPKAPSDSAHAAFTVFSFAFTLVAAIVWAGQVSSSPPAADFCPSPIAVLGRVFSLAVSLLISGSLASGIRLLSLPTRAS